MTRKMANLHRRLCQLEAITPTQPLLNRAELQELSLARLSAEDRALVEEAIARDAGKFSDAQMEALQRWDKALASICAETGYPHVHAFEWQL